MNEKIAMGVAASAAMLADEPIETLEIRIKKTKSPDIREDIMRKFSDTEVAKLPRFKNLGVEGPRGCFFLSLKTLLLELQRRQMKEYLYVILDNGEIRITESTWGGEIKFHTDLVDSKDDCVIAAGEIFINNGQCIINNKSGNYRPYGKHLEEYVLSKVLPCFQGKEDRVKFSYFQAYKELAEAKLAKEAADKKLAEAELAKKAAIKKSVETGLAKQAAEEKLRATQKKLEAAEAALAARRDLERQLAEKKAELAKLAKAEQEAKAAADKEAWLTTASSSELLAAISSCYDRRIHAEISRRANDARIISDNALRAAGLLTVNGLLKSTIRPTQLTASSSFSDAFIAIKNVRNNAELNKAENWFEYSKQLGAFQDYLFSKVGRRLPILPHILKDHPTVSTADEFYALAQQYIKGDKEQDHFSLDCLHMAVAMNPNHHNALCLIGVIYFQKLFGTQETHEEGLEYLKRAKEKGNQLATYLMSNVSHNMRCNDKFLVALNRIGSAIKQGRFNFIESSVSQNDVSSDGATSHSNNSADDYDHRGEHSGSWGARGGSDMWRGGSTSGNGAQWEYAGTETRATGTTCDRYTRDGVTCYTNLR